MQISLETLSADADRLQRQFETFLGEMESLPVASLSFEFRANILKDSVHILAKLTAIRKTLVALRVYAGPNFEQWKNLSVSLVSTTYTLNHLQQQMQSAREKKASSPAASNNLTPSPSSTQSAYSTQSPSSTQSTSSTLSTPSTPSTSSTSSIQSPSLTLSTQSAQSTQTLSAPSSTKTPSSTQSTPTTPAPKRAANSAMPQFADVDAFYDYMDELDEYAASPAGPDALIPPARFKHAPDPAADTGAFARPLRSDPEVMRLFALPRAAAAQITGVPATLRRLSRTIPTLPHFDAPDFPDHLAQTLATTESHLHQTRHTLLENFPPSSTPQPHIGAIPHAAPAPPESPSAPGTPQPHPTSTPNSATPAPDPGSPFRTSAGQHVTHPPAPPG